MLLEQQDAITLQARVSKQGGYFRVIPESNRILTLVNVPIRYINSAIAAKWLTHPAFFALFSRFEEVTSLRRRRHLRRVQRPRQAGGAL